MISQGVSWFEHEPIDLTQAEHKLGDSLGLKKGVRLIPNFSKASRILSLDSDFLGNREPNSLGNTRSLMKGRKVLSPSDAKKMNRLYSVESDLTITGGVADHRLRLNSSEFSAFCYLLISEILKYSEIQLPLLIKNLQSRGVSLKTTLKNGFQNVLKIYAKPNKSIVVPESSTSGCASFMLCYQSGAWCYW